MNSDIFEGQWRAMVGEIRRQWGALTHDDLEQVKGSRDKLIGLVQAKYGKAVEEAKRDVDKVADSFDDLAWKGEWNQIRGKAREYWGELTDNDLDKVAGRQTQLVGVLQERYGRSREQAWQEVREFLDKF